MRFPIAFTSALVHWIAMVGFAKPVPAAEGSPVAPLFTAEQVSFYEKEVRPILQNRCLKCHGGEADLKGEFRLTSRAAVLIGGESGEPAVQLDQPDKSPLVLAINHRGLEMPPKTKLPDAEIETLTKWVRAGLPWTPGQEEPIVKPKKKRAITEEDRAYWAYKPVQRPEAPAVRDQKWTRNPIDAFVLKQLEEKGLTPAAPADRVALIRRAYYDLIGLPPTPNEVDQFVGDKDPAAYEKLLDKLLASKQYGEKWGRHWLDVVRYAETNGYERDSAKPFAWRYRDYVIDAFNSDKPYDAFLREQIAGDQIDKVTSESMIATGYYRLGIWDDEPADRQQAKYDVLDGIVSTTSSAFLGASIGCARCHDHKKDPILQRDYYRLLAFFSDVSDMNKANTKKIATDEDRRLSEQAVKEKAARESALTQQIYQSEQKFAVALAEKKGLAVTTLPKSDLDGVQYKFYRDTWTKLPDFDGLKHETEGPIADNYLALTPASRQEAIGFVFTGNLRVPQDGEYTFAIESTDGSRLSLDGKAIWDKPDQGRQRGTAKASLKAGLVPLRLDYFNGYEKPFLRITWSGPGFEVRPLTSAGPIAPGQEKVILADGRKQGHTWRYTMTEPSRAWMEGRFDDGEWRSGQSGFGTRGTPGSFPRTEWNTKDIWLRKSFALDAVPGSLFLDVHHDEDIEIYFNGKLAYQAKRYLKGYERVALPESATKLLQQGDNVIAVHCHQSVGGQYVDLGLVTGNISVDLPDLIRRHGAAVLDQTAVDQYLELTKQLAASREVLPALPGLEVMCVEEKGHNPTHVLMRGNPAAPGEQVEAGAPEVLCSAAIPTPPIDAKAESSGKRRALADWLTNPANPLTARVFVNRLWQHHFGRGLVPTPNDFGKLGEAPTHPELLDWLASEFVAGGWRVKRMQKLIMLSNAYQMSSRLNEAAFKVDGGNSLLWRFNMRRLAAEEVRDSILAVCGQLNVKAGGPSVFPPIPKEVLAGQSVPGAGWSKSSPEESARRSVYVHVKRSLLVPILSQHDQADTDSSCPVRYTTTVPTQALGMLNGEFTNEQASELAARLEREAPGDLSGQIRRALRLTSARQPTDAEVSRDAKFIAALREKHHLTANEALQKYCLLILNTNEFLYLD